MECDAVLNSSDTTASPSLVMNGNQNPSQDATKKSGITMIVLAWLCLILLAGYYFYRAELDAIDPNRHANVDFVNGIETLELTANRDNHYFAPGKINGRDASFLLDTGATTVSIPAAMREKYGLQAKEDGWAYTANGRVRVQSTTIPKLEIAGIVLTDVDATLNPGMNDSDLVLLGMSALSRLNITINDGKLTIAP